MAVTHMFIEEGKVLCGQVVKKNPLITTKVESEVTCKKCLIQLKKKKEQDEVVLSGKVEEPVVKEEPVNDIEKEVVEEDLEKIEEELIDELMKISK